MNPFSKWRTLHQPLLAASLFALVASLNYSWAQNSALPWNRHTIDNTSKGADGVKLMDLNNDALIDLVTGWEEGGSIRVYFHPGKRNVKNPWRKVEVGKVGSPEDAVPADLDGDGYVDVVSACEGKVQSIHFHFAPSQRAEYLNAAAWSTTPVPATKGRQWMFILPMQVDGKNGIDLIVGSKGDNGIVGWLESPSAARKTEDWKLHKLRDAGWIMSLIAHDIDGDGDDDIVSSDRKGKISGVFWLENPGAQANRQPRPWLEHKIGAEGREVMFIDLFDQEGDGRIEIAAAVKPAHVFILRQSSLPTESWFTQVIALDPPALGGAKGIAVADLTLDRNLDLVLSFEGATGDKAGVALARLPSTESIPGSAIQNVSGLQGVKFDLIALHDLDADGDLDILTCEEVDQLGVIWYENPAR